MKKEDYILNDEPLLKVEKKLNNVEKKIDGTSFAMEILQELKKSSQRKFVIIIILIIALIGTNIAWLLYNNQFETIKTEETGQYIEDISGDNSQFTQTIN